MAKEKKKKRLATMEIAGKTIDIDIDDLHDNLLTIQAELARYAKMMGELLSLRMDRERALGYLETNRNDLQRLNKEIATYATEWGV